MKKKATLLAVSALLALLLAMGGYVWYGTRRAKALMQDYLDREGYPETAVTSITVSHSFVNLLLSYPEWIIRVVYEDEPDSVYSYHIRDGAIVPGGVSGTTPKEDLKH